MFMIIRSQAEEIRLLRQQLQEALAKGTSQQEEVDLKFELTGSYISDVAASS